MKLADLIGKNVFVRTVTHHYTGHLTGFEQGGFLELDDAAWIADAEILEQQRDLPEPLRDALEEQGHPVLLRDALAMLWSYYLLIVAAAVVVVAAVGFLLGAGTDW